MEDIDYFRLGLKKTLEDGGRGAATNLALDAPISDSYISQLISGKRKDPSRKTIRKICTALNTTEMEMIRKGRDAVLDFEPTNPPAPKGGDYTEILERYIVHLEKENERLEAESLRLTTGDFDRRKSGGA